jgi:hypothetical protein
MKKKHLSKNEKMVMVKLNKEPYQGIEAFFSNEKMDAAAQNLKELGFVNPYRSKFAGQIYRASLTDSGEAYLANNPKLKNSMTENFKWWIGCLIALLSVLVAIFTLIKK